MSATAASASPSKVVAMSECKQCKQSIPSDALERHIDFACPASVVSCVECDAQLTRGSLSKHMSYECPNTESACPFAEYGCPIKIGKHANSAAKVAAMQAHVTSEAASHTRWVTGVVDAQRAQRTALQAAADRADFDIRDLTAEINQIRRQLATATTSRVAFQKQLGEYKTTLAGYTQYMQSKLSAMTKEEALALMGPPPSANATGDVKSKKPQSAGAGDTKSAGGDTKSGGDAKARAAEEKAESFAAAKAAGIDLSDDPKLRGFADAKRGADALIVRYQAKTAATPPLTELLPKLKISTEAMQKFSRVTLTDVTMLNHIRTYPPSDYRSFSDRKLVAEFVNTYYGVRAGSVSEAKAQRQLMKQQRFDSALVYAVCAAAVAEPHADATPEQINLVDQIAMESAKNMADGGRMITAYERVLSRGVSSLSPDDVSSMWVFSAVLGRWSMVKDFAAKMVAINPQVMEVIHDNAQSSPVTPDMKLLTDFATVEPKSGKLRPNLDPGSLNFSTYRVRSIVLKLIDVESDDKQLVAALKADDAGRPEGKNVAVGEAADGSPIDLMFMCHGAYGQLVSPTSANPMVLVGPVYPNKLTLSGFLALEEEGATLRTEESYVFDKKEVTTNGDGETVTTWMGQLTMSSLAGGKLQKQAMEVRYAAKMQIVPVSSVYFDEPATPAAAATATAAAPAAATEKKTKKKK